MPCGHLLDIHRIFASTLNPKGGLHEARRAGSSIDIAGNAEAMGNVAN